MVDRAVRDAGARDEAAQRTKILIDAVQPVAKSESLAVARQADVPQRCVLHHAARLVIALGALKGRGVHLAERVAAVDAGNAIVVRAGDAVGVRHADARLVADVALRPHDVEVRRVVAARRQARVIAGGQHADVQAGDGAGELERALRLCDATRVDQVVRNVELLEPVEKERPLLGKEERLPRIDHELPGVRLHLGKVGKHGSVHRQIVGHAPPDVPTELRPRMRVCPTGRTRRTGRFARDNRIQIEHEAAIESAESVERAALREKRRVRALCRRPTVLEARVLHLAHDVDVPALLVRRLKFETFERNAKLDLVAVFGEPSFRREHKVLTQVGRRAAGKGRRPTAGARLPRLDDRPIELNAEWIHSEDERLSLIVKGAEQQLHVVVGADLVAIGQRGVDGAVRLEGAYADVQRGR